MAQTGYTPILIYASGTTGHVPSAGNLTSGSSGAELALNYYDGLLFYKDNNGVVQQIGTKLPVGVPYGGTGLTSLTAGSLVYGNGTSAFNSLAIGTSSYVLTSSGTAPQWSAPSGLSVGTATNLAGGLVNQVPYQTAAGATSFIAAPSVSNTFLTWTGSAFAWSATSGSTTQSLTINDSGSGASSPASFNGSSAVTISYNTVGAPSTTGTNATGTWGISISGNAATATSATNATTATSATQLVTTDFSIQESGGKLYFYHGATAIASLDSSGNFTSLANVTAYGTP